MMDNIEVKDILKDVEYELKSVSFRLKNVTKDILYIKETLSLLEKDINDQGSENTMDEKLQEKK